MSKALALLFLLVLSLPARAQPQLPPPPKALYPCSETSPCVEVMREDFQTLIYPDLIDRQQGLNQIIGPPLSHSATVCIDRDNNDCREIDEFETIIDGVRSSEGFRHRSLPSILQQTAIAHLLKGGPLRAGDVMVLHGSLLGALQPNTFGLAKKWQKLVHESCILKEDACPGY